MNGLKAITIEIPVPVWGRLASKADDAGRRIADIARDALTALVPDPSNDPVVVLARLGYPDREIAARLVLTNEQVARRRRAGRVPANRIPRGSR